MDLAKSVLIESKMIEVSQKVKSLVSDTTKNVSAEVASEIIEYIIEELQIFADGLDN